MKIHLFFAEMLVIFLFLTSCSKDVVSVDEQFIFLGHIYQPGYENRIDFRFDDVQFDRFNKILLGGDLCVETTKATSTLTYLDSIFHLSAESTLWAVGNHDVRNGNIERITDITQRPLSYSFEQNRIRYIILNTNYTGDECNALESQFSMLEAGLKEFRAADQILIISHHAIWTDYLMMLGEQFTANARHSNWKTHCRDAENNFSEAIAPLLSSAADQGVLILWISGDFGQKRSAYQFMVKPNLYFLGSGIDSNKQNTTDSVLVLHYKSAEQLTWDFIPIENL